MPSFPFLSFTDTTNDNNYHTDQILLTIDILITRIFSYFNFCIWIFLIIYNVRYIIKNPESKPHNFVLSLHLFFICTLYNVTFILPLTTTDTSYKSDLYFSIEYGKTTTNNFFCALQGIIYTACLLGMLSISLCIAINCYFNLFKKSLSKNVELAMTSGSLIFAFLLSSSCLFDSNDDQHEGAMLIEANLLCWPYNRVWRLVFDIFFCGVYIANFTFIVIIVVKLFRINTEEAKKYIYRMILLGVILVTLFIYFADLIHSLYKNAKFLIIGDTTDNSNITNMWFCLSRDFLVMCTGISLMIIYKPKFPKILCFKDKPDDERDDSLTVEDTTNELIEVNAM